MHTTIRGSASIACDRGSACKCSAHRAWHRHSTQRTGLHCLRHPHVCPPFSWRQHHPEDCLPTGQDRARSIHMHGLHALGKGDEVRRTTTCPCMLGTQAAPHRPSPCKAASPFRRTAGRRGRCVRRTSRRLAARPPSRRRCRFAPATGSRQRRPPLPSRCRSPRGPRGCPRPPAHARMSRHWSPSVCLL